MVEASGVLTCGVVGDGGGCLKAVKVAIGISQTVLRRPGQDRTYTIGPIHIPAPDSKLGFPAPDGRTSILVNFLSKRHDLPRLSEALGLVEVSGQDAGRVKRTA